MEFANSRAVFLFQFFAKLTSTLAMIELFNVTKIYSDRIKAVDNISFHVKEAETVVLLGTSGCGKTTTLRMINLLEKPDSGKILIDKKDQLQVAPEMLRRQIGYVLQHTGLFPHYSIAKNIAVVPSLLNWSKDRVNDRIRELMEKLHLNGLDPYKTFPHQLSGGQQQRVGLARALAANQSILLMDEPFGALDPITRSQIRTEFKEIDELSQKTILMVTHDVAEAFEVADRICLMNQGKIVQVGTPTELLFNPSSDFVRNFLNVQRLGLELRVLTLELLLPHMFCDDCTSDAYPLMDLSSSLQELIERFSSDANNEKLSALWNQRTVCFTLAMVMKSFTTFKSGKYE